MSERLPERPAWADKALQGLAFWIGHRRTLYRHHPLSEGALVAEACNLICPSPESGKLLLCEEQYSRLMPNGGWPAELGPRARADLIFLAGISSREAKVSASLLRFAREVIEVKRGSASSREVQEDLRRLATLKAANSSVRAFLLLVAEARRPQQFISEKGLAIRGKFDIPTTGCHYQVRRVCKAASSFNGKESCHYAIILEIFNTR